MTVLVVGASGATGRLLVQQLLERGQNVKIIVRSPGALPEALKQNERLTVISASLLDLSDAEMAEQAKGCTAVASCLGHNLNFKGIFGHPRRLVTEAAKRLCAAILANQAENPVRFVLMNTAGNSNRNLSEPLSMGERLVMGVIRRMVPPHADNEQAADYLRIQIGQDNKAIEWVIVRPDTLIDEENVTEYELHPSPTRSALFDAGKVSRINVGHFMAELITNDSTWNRWKGQMPVIYNKISNEFKNEFQRQ